MLLSVKMGFSFKNIRVVLILAVMTMAKEPIPEIPKIPKALPDKPMVLLLLALHAKKARNTIRRMNQITQTVVLM